MPETWIRAVLRVLLRAYPPRWRRRYGPEMRELVEEGRPGLRDLADLARSALSEWDREIARGPLALLKAVVAAYLVLMLVFLSVSTLASIAVYGIRWANAWPDPEAIVGYPAMGGVFFGAAIFYTAPLLLSLRLARRWIPLAAARSLAAAGLSAFAVLVLYRLDWYDVWRHGFPGVGYLAYSFVPIALAFAAAGAILGGVLARRPHAEEARRQWR